MIWMSRLFGALALLGFAAAVWFAGPLIGFDGGKPLSPAWIRLLIVGIVVFAVLAFYAVRFLREMRSQQALENALAPARDAGGEAHANEQRMLQAIATLKRSGGRNFLYDLPWYMVIGPPGAGKTTALVNSGLKFPLQGSGDAIAVAGVGGTRSCEWWFTNDAILIDTAGRYTTQDSQPGEDSAAWLAFLDTLARHRPRQPINGVILAFSVADLLSLDQPGLNAHAAAIRSRIDEVHQRLRIDFPVYLLFTKADLIAGFMEYFGRLDEDRRQKVWGTSFPSIAPNKELLRAVPGELDAMAVRLSDEVPDHLQEENDPVARTSVFGFPSQFDALKAKLTQFAAAIFQESGGGKGATFRGFYLSSGTQEGTPFDQFLGTFADRLGPSVRAQMSGKGKSFFLHDLLQRVVFAEAGWASRDKIADRRTRLLRSGAAAAIVLIALAAVGAFGTSFLANRSLIQSTSQAIGQYREIAQSLLDMPAVADSDLENVIGPLDALREMPVGYDNRDAVVPLLEKLGLGQRERLVASAETAYRLGLERMLRSRLLLQMEDTIRANMGEPRKLYEPLKIYLMLGGQAPKADDELIVAWLRKDWEQRLYPGSQNRDGRLALEKHVRAMLALDDEHDPLYPLDRELVESAQRSLGQMTIADRAEAFLISAKAPPSVVDFSFALAGGPEAPLVFEPTDGSELARLKVPGLYTYAGFNDFYLKQLAGIADKLAGEQWVIGQGAEQGSTEAELLRLGPELLDRYSRDFGQAWNAALDKLNFKEMSSDKPKFTALSSAASPSSPILQLFTAIARETAVNAEQAETATDDALAAEAEGLAKLGIQLPNGKSRARAGAAFDQGGGRNPGANIEAQFRPFQQLVAGRAGQRPIDSLIQNFHDIYQTMLTSASMPADGQRANLNLPLQISSLRANASRLPKALARMVQSVADDFEGDAAETTIARLNQLLDETVRGPCEETVTNRFPFAGNTSNDVPMDEFARLFAPGGVLDRFFAQNVSALADTSGADWDWKQTTRIGRELSKVTLKKFQLASEIRDAFFPLGGSVPAVNVTFTPTSLNADADQALLDVNGQVVQAYQTGNSPGIVTWPGNTPDGSVHLSLIPELPGRESSVSFTGPWALKRFLDAATMTKSDEGMEARVVIGGRDVAYKIQVNSPLNPFWLPAITAFSCPDAF